MNQNVRHLISRLDISNVDLIRTWKDVDEKMLYLIFCTAFSLVVMLYYGLTWYKCKMISINYIKFAMCTKCILRYNCYGNLCENFNPYYQEKCLLLKNTLEKIQQFNYQKMPKYIKRCFTCRSYSCGNSWLHHGRANPSPSWFKVLFIYLFIFFHGKIRISTSTII